MLTARLRAVREEKGWGRFMVFLLVGVLNTAFGYGLYALLLWAGLHYAVAALIGTVLGVLFNFRTIGRLVFCSQDNGRLLRFSTVYALGYGLNLAGLWLLQAAGLDAYRSGMVLLLPMAFLSFFLQQRFVFTGPPMPVADRS